MNYRLLLTGIRLSLSAEEEIIAERKLQLTLYSLALEISERTKPEHERRNILPPAIQVSASGRMIGMRDEDFKQSRIDLISLVEWSGEMGAGKVPTSARLPMSEQETCRTCPCYSGTIRLCGPIDEKLAQHNLRFRKPSFAAT